MSHPYPRLLKLALQVAVPNKVELYKSQFVGAVAVLPSGLIVSARNLSTDTPIPSVHAESRCCVKATRGSVYYVARVLRGTGLAGMARPCAHCQTRLRLARAAKVYYTISPTEYGVLTFV